jgi:hypothetical protein
MDTYQSLVRKFVRNLFMARIINTHKDLYINKIRNSYLFATYTRTREGLLCIRTEIRTGALW